MERALQKNSSTLHVKPIIHIEYIYFFFLHATVTHFISLHCYFSLSQNKNVSAIWVLRPPRLLSTHTRLEFLLHAAALPGAGSIPPREGGTLHSFSRCVEAAAPFPCLFLLLDLFLGLLLPGPSLDALQVLKVIDLTRPMWSLLSVEKHKIQPIQPCNIKKSHERIVG